MFNLSDLFNFYGILLIVVLIVFICFLMCVFIKEEIEKRKSKPISGREYAEKYGECPMCEDCPHNCPFDFSKCY